MSEFNYLHLKNGLEVCLQKSTFAPLVSLQMQVRVGSLDETPEEAGMAHVLEHMLFKGTKKFPLSGEIATLVERAGGDINAYTTFDHTCYYLTAPSSFWKMGTTMLVDVLSESLLDREELSRELEVVLEEIKRGRDSPSHHVSRNTFETLFAGSDLARPVIGYEEIVKTFTREKLLAFYHRWYVPRNMSFVAVGDFDEAEMTAHLEMLHTGLRNPELPKRNRQLQVIRNVSGLQTNKSNEISSENRLKEPPFLPVTLHFGPYQEARMQLSAPCPTLEDPSTPAWDMFLSVLGNGDTSRLTRIVKEEMQLVTSVDAGTFTPVFSSGFAAVSFYGKQNLADAALIEILNQIFNLAKEDPSEVECKRVVSTSFAERIYSQESVDGLARSATQNLLTLQKLKFEEKYLQQLQNVRPSHISTCAKLYLLSLMNGEGCISGAITGEGQFSSIETQNSYKAKLQIAIEMWFDKNKPSIVSWQKELSAHLAKSVNSAKNAENNANSISIHISAHNSELVQHATTLSNGVEVHFNFRASQRLPIFSSAVAWQRSLGLETKDFAGVGQLASTMLTRGNSHQSYDEFVDELEDRVASIGCFSTKDLVGMRINSLAADASRTFEMGMQSLFQAQFNDVQFQRVLAETKEVVVAQRDNPGNRLARLTAPKLYGDHPYAIPTLGDLSSLEKMNKELIEKHWLLQFPTQNVAQKEKHKIVVSAAGTFSHEKLISQFLQSAESFYETQKSFQNNVPLARVGYNPRFLSRNEPEICFDVLEREQAQIALTFRAFPMSNTKRTALELASQILSGQGGRLFLDLRDKRSLAYSVGSAHAPALLAGSFQFFIATGAEKTKEAIDGLCEHVKKMADTLCDSEEIERAKSSLLGSIAIEAQHHHTQASQLLMGDVLGLPFDNFCTLPARVRAITRENILEAFQEMLSQSAPVLSIVGPKGTFVPSNLQTF